MKTKRAAIYPRVSSTRQATEGASLADQETDCRNYAARHGWEIAGIYVEAGRSAYTEDLRRRPAFQRMIADARAGKFDVLLVYELSRFGRRSQAFAVGEDLERVGVRLVSVTEHFDQSTVEGFVTYSILKMQAELQSRLLSRRIKAVRDRERSEGRLSKRAATGQRWVDGNLVWDEAESRLPRRAYALAAQGLSTHKILRALADEGLITNHGTLGYMLNNPAYAGLMRDGDGLTPTAWPALIDRAQWEQVQALRAARRPGLAVRAVVRTMHDSLLAGVVYCANCGAKMHFNQTGEYSYYRCTCRHEGGHCNARPSRASRVDAQVADIVAQLRLSDESILRILREAKLPPPQRQQADPAEQLRRLGRAFADGLIDDEEYERRRDALRLAASRFAPAPAIHVDRLAALLQDLPRLWEAAETEGRRAIVAGIFSQVYARQGVVYAVRGQPDAMPLLREIWSVGGISVKSGHVSRSSVPLLEAA